MNEMKQHPLSAAFPSMSSDDYQALKDDIEYHGQREPVIVLDGMVLDGWHRYRACIELGIKPTQFSFSDADPVAFVKSQNLHRRHLTASQRAAAVVACSTWAPAQRPNKVEMVSTLPVKNSEMAKEAGTTVRTVTDAKTAHSAGLGKLVIDGAMTANEAAKVARGTPSKPAPKPEVTQAPPPEDDGPTAAEIAASEREAAEEIEALRKVALADDKVAAALDEAKKLRALNRVLQERNDGLMNEKAELVKRIKALQRKLDKLEQPA